MPTVRKTITLTAMQDDWIKAQIDKGGYANDSEFIGDLIRREQERQLESSAEIDSIRAALIKGERLIETQGWVTKSAREMLDSFKEKARTDGRL